jgi:choline kinase
MKHINPQVRNILKCDFVEKLVISNHNPEMSIENKVETRDKRLVFINQETKRGCGYRWVIANGFNPEYLIVVDDDILLFPSQLQKLFEN